MTSRRYDAGMPPPETSAPERDRPSLLKRLVDLAVGLLYRSVEVFRHPTATFSGPTIVIANHFGGLADALLLVAALDDVPRILARDRIWRIPLVRRLMDAVGAIPVHKPEDRSTPVSNADMFTAAYAALADGDTILIFPEGITVDDPRIARLKTGAARIALGARADGVAGIQIVPIGLHYEDKAALRSRVSVIVGEPVDLDATLAAMGVDAPTPDDRDLVRTLTDTFERRLREVAPDFENWREATDLTFAAEVALRAASADPDRPVSLAERDRLANRLAQAPPEDRAGILAAVERYRRDLEAVGMSDRGTYRGMGTAEFLRHVAGTLLLGAILVPFALVGIATSIPPLLVIFGLGKLPVSPAVKATLKPAAALVLFPLAWGVAAWRIVFEHLGPIWTIVAIGLVPLYLVAGIVITERVVLLWRALRAWRGRKGLREAAERIAAGRAAVVAAVATRSDDPAAPPG